LSQQAPTRGATGRLDLIACDGCGRSFTTEDGPGMIAAISGQCPDCGGSFALAVPATRRRPQPERHEAWADQRPAP
jgi:hypothetical protein